MNALEGQEWINLHEDINNVDETSDNESNEITLTGRLTSTVSLFLSRLSQAIAAKIFKIFKVFIDTLTTNNSN